MQRERDRDSGSVEVGPSHVIVRRPHTRQKQMAGILHQRRDAEGRATWIVLDRLVHDVGDAEIGGWPVSGAVTTELGFSPAAPLLGIEGGNYAPHA